MYIYNAYDITYMAIEVVKANTTWRIHKFVDPNGEIAELSRKGVPINQITNVYNERFIGTEIIRKNILLNEGITKIWELLIGSYASVSGEQIGTGDGYTTTFTATLSNKPIKPGTVKVTDGVETFTDNGDGTLTGSSGGSGTINYVTGEISVTFASAPASGSTITADYQWLDVFDANYAEIGVGDSTTAEDPTQTDLLGTNTFYKGMDSGYPVVNGQTVTFRATFGPNDANFTWNEFTTRHSVTLINLNRKVEAKGTKSVGETWIVELSITLS